MKYRLLTSIICGTSAMILSKSAEASSITLVPVLEVASQVTPAGLRDVFRVYAQFENPADRVNRWYGDAPNPMTIQNVLSDGATLGTGFTQFGGSGGQLAPYHHPLRDWDTYATIGVRFGQDAPGGQDATALTAGFPPFIASNTFQTNSGAVFLIPQTAVQGRADWRVVENDTNLRVMLMQLTVMPGQHVRGTINVDGQFWNGTGYENFSAVGLTFASIPAPGGLVLLGLTGAIPKRGRRMISGQ